MYIYIHMHTYVCVFVYVYTETFYLMSKVSVGVGTYPRLCSWPEARLGLQFRFLLIQEIQAAFIEQGCSAILLL